MQGPLRQGSGPAIGRGSHDTEAKTAQSKHSKDGDQDRPELRLRQAPEDRAYPRPEQTKRSAANLHQAELYEPLDADQAGEGTYQNREALPPSVLQTRSISRRIDRSAAEAACSSSWSNISLP